MYYITKLFKFPAGHRLSKLKDSRCHFYHGHSFCLEITIKSKFLNDNDMVMDFSKLKDLVEEKIDGWDHGMFVNISDKTIDPKFCRINYINGDPTAENLCKFLFDEIEKIISDNGVKIHSVSIWETEESKATFKLD